MGLKCNVSFGFLIISVTLSIISYYVYGRSIDAALGIFLLNIIDILPILLGLVPIAGPFLTYFTWNWLFDIIVGWTGIYQTWLTSLIFTIAMFSSIILNIISSYFVYKFMKYR